MQVLHPRCAGIDVHKDSVVVCVRLMGDDGGGRAREEVRTYGTTTRELLRLGDWLAERRVTAAAMESTGVYWKPVWNLLEGRAGLALMLVNARHVKQVPGRKTDVKDCQWLAQLLQHGLLSPSFVPDRPQRELRDLTRQRAQLVMDKARVANRIHKTLEDANIKLASVASDVLGASGRDMIRALIEGKLSPQAMAELARMRLRAKIPQLTEALSGGVTDHHRFMLKALLEQVEHLEAQVESFDARVEQVMGPFQKQAVRLLDGIKGLDVRAAQNVVAEIGTDMTRFPTAGHLASWAGLCPGNNQSAGRRRGGRTTPGNRWLKRTLTQCAWAATRAKDSHLAARYKRLASRRGRKRAVLAVAHSQLTAAYEMLKNGTEYRDLGAAHFDALGRERLTRQLVHRLEDLGYTVSLKTDAA